MDGDIPRRYYSETWLVHRALARDVQQIREQVTLPQERSRKECLNYGSQSREHLAAATRSEINVASKTQFTLLLLSR